VPFADLKLDYQGQKLSLHDYFFAKSVDALKPKGVLALVTTHFTLDKQNAAIREYLGSKADFVGAIRLPSDALQTRRHRRRPPTSSSYGKRSPGEHARHEEAEWQRAMPMEIDGMEVPDQPLLRPPSGNGFWAPGAARTRSTAVKATAFFPTATSLSSFARRPSTCRNSLRSKYPRPRNRLPQNSPPPPPERHITEGSFFVAG